MSMLSAMSSQAIYDEVHNEATSKAATDVCESSMSSTDQSSSSSFGNSSSLPLTVDIINAQKYSESRSRLLRSKMKLAASPWCQCAASFVIFFNTWGLVNTYAHISSGVFQQYYQSILLATESASRISWIGSIQAFMLVFITIIGGPIFDMGYARSMVLGGSVLIVLGMMLTSICSHYWEFVLTQGFVVGLGNGLLFMPSIGIIAAHFAKRRALAMGIAASGSCLGAIFYTGIFTPLVTAVEFDWTSRIIAFIMLSLQSIPMIIVNSPVATRRRRDLLDPTVLKDSAFLSFAFSVLMAFIGLYIPFFYIQAEAQEQGSISASLNFYLLMLLNVGSLLGRIIPSFIADSVGSVETLIPCTFIAGITALAWIVVDSQGGYITFALLYGFFSGAFVSLSPTITMRLCPNFSVYGTRSGIISIPMSLGLLIGNPIAGALTANEYLGLKIFTGVTVIIAAIFLSLCRYYIK